MSTEPPIQENTSSQNQEVVHGSPTKEFFISMITKDIQWQDCILDLLDNSIDGAQKLALNKKRKELSDAGSENTRIEFDQLSLEGYYCHITISEDKFEIMDNCGGIAISDAIDYAFHFGRRRDAPPAGEGSIGLYGIGMKRAIFKIGKDISVKSYTEKEGFEVNIDVNAWRLNDENWDFPLSRLKKEETVATKPGTIITINNLNQDVAIEFANPVHINRLHTIISLDYSMFIQRGFQIILNGDKVVAEKFTWRYSDDIQPAKSVYYDMPKLILDKNEVPQVKVEIFAGMGGVPPEDTSAEAALDNPQKYGWFVVCNDRVVLAADKTYRTVWGDDTFARWHPQFNGFLGVVKFSSDDPKLLPWSTTKREIVLSDPMYRRAIHKMKELTKPYLKYTTTRRRDLLLAQRLERNTQRIEMNQVASNSTTKIPQIDKPESEEEEIRYIRSRTEIRRVAEALGNRRMSNTAVGIATFEYFVGSEIS